MNVVVSNNAIEYTGFVKVSKLKEVEKLKGNIDFLIYHKSHESEDEKVSALTLLKDKVGKLIYIRNSEDIETPVQIIVTGSGGKYFDDEFFLESTEELSNLINNLEEVTAIAQLGGVNVVSDFFNRYLSDGSSNFSKDYLLVVKKAVSSMIADYQDKDYELLQLSETATEIFANSANLINKVEEEKENLKNAVMKLKEAKETIIQPQVSVQTGPSIVFFPQVSYAKEKNIIRIKEIGTFSMLTSFMLGFVEYLDKRKYLRPKLIVIEPVGELYEDLYNEYEWVNQQNSKNMIGFSKIVFINYPTREILNRVLDDTSYDTFIILDRLKLSSQHILNCKGTPVRYAVSSEGFLERTKLKALNCFFPKKVKNSLFSLNWDESYPTEVSQREAYYMREYQSAYELLYSVRGK